MFPKTGRALVKQVLSGDTVVLLRQQDGKPIELQMSLSSIVAPKIARGPDTEEEPFAFQSREFLRKLVIGKDIAYKVEYKVEAIKRTFGALYLDESVVKKIVREGWANVRIDKTNTKSGRSEDYEELLELTELAKYNHSGVFDEISSGRRKMKWMLPDPLQFYKDIKGIPQYGIVEYVRDGSSFKVYLPLHSMLITLNLAGVICPQINKRNELGDLVPEQYSVEARYFSELRVLNRDILVYIEGVDKNGNFIGSFEHPCGNLSEELLKAGLGTITEWSIQFTNATNVTALRRGQQYAKDHKMRLWKNYIAPVIVGATDFTGIVSEILNPDCLIILCGDNPDSPIRKIYLSSIKAPKNLPESPEPYYYEAKSLVRSRCIGRKADIHIDYTRKIEQKDGTIQERYYATVLLLDNNNLNIAEELCLKGLASVIHHRQDEERSCKYDSLVAAEDDAKRNHKGMYNNKQPPNNLINDLCNNSSKAKQFFSFLERKKTMNAIVEYCFSASRFKLHIPSENCDIMFSLSGVKSPNPPKSVKGKDIEGEPFGLEALNYTKFYINQHDVEIEVESIDKNGLFLGNLAFYNNTIPVSSGKKRQREILSTLLLKQGYASTISFTINKVKDREMLLSAEKHAQDLHLGIWKDYNPSATVSAAIASPSKSNSYEQVIKGKVTEVVDGKHFYIMPIDNNLREIEEMMNRFGLDVGIHPCNEICIKLKKGTRCLSLYDDNTGLKWYRAILIDYNLSKNQGTIFYVDYGNTSTTALTNLRPCENEHFKYPYQVRQCELSGVLCPDVNKELGIECAEYLSSLIYDREIIVKMLNRSEPYETIVFTDGDNKIINEEMILQGFGRYYKKIEKRYPSEREIWLRLEDAHYDAAKNRLNLFRYGDLGFDDDDDEIF